MSYNHTLQDIDNLIAEKIYNINLKAETEIQISDAIITNFVAKFFDDQKNTWIYVFKWNGNEYEVPWTPMKQIDFAYSIYANRADKVYATDLEIFIEGYRRKAPTYSQDLMLAYDAAQIAKIFQHIIFMQDYGKTTWSAYQRGVEIADEKTCSFLEQIHLLTAETLSEAICRTIVYFEEQKNESASGNHQHGDRQLSKTG